MPRVQLAVRSRKPAAPCTSRKCSCKPGQKAEGSRGLRQVNRNRQTGDEEENALGPHSHTVKCRHGTTLAERPGGSPRCAWGQERGLRMCKVGAAPSFRSPFLHPLRARGSRSVRLRGRETPLQELGQMPAAFFLPPSSHGLACGADAAIGSAGKAGQESPSSSQRIKKGSPGAGKHLDKGRHLGRPFRAHWARLDRGPRVRACALTPDGPSQTLRSGLQAATRRHSAAQIQTGARKGSENPMESAAHERLGGTCSLNPAAQRLSLQNLNKTQRLRI